jgi:wyosine [tRNA(Phe)-imidazoG37] synthetase (radical SAM superfamily)
MASERNPAIGSAPTPVRRIEGTVAGAREFLDNHYVYLFFSPRAGGLTLGINLNPDRTCNFDCIYCEVHRHRPQANGVFRVEAMADELTRLLTRIYQGRLRDIQPFHNLPTELLELKHVALSGEGEPTLSPFFADTVQAVVHIRAQGAFPFFKIVLLSNASLLDQPEVQAGLRHLILKDEVWLKLDAGTSEAFEAINRPQVPFRRVLDNILQLGRQRPVVIQSLFPLIQGVEPDPAEIRAYIDRLKHLQSGGAQIALVQVYSATRPTARSGCRHLPLKVLSQIAHQVRDETGLQVQVF